MLEPSADVLIQGLLWFLIFLFSLTCHEAAHAWAALRLGDPTAHAGGQVSLSPWPHIRRAPFGTVVIPLVSYLVNGWMIGWASAPYDPRWAHTYPKRAGWMAAAGPAANLVLLVVAGVAIHVGRGLGYLDAPDEVTFTRIVAAVDPAIAGLATALSILFMLNLILFAFNLVPLPPLDGSGILQLLLPERAARAYQEALMGQPALGLVGILVAWYLFGAVFPSIHLLALRCLYPDLIYS